MKNTRAMQALSAGDQNSEMPSPRTKNAYSVLFALDALRELLDLPQTVPHALERMRQYLESGLMMFLYQECFPEEYVASEASFKIDEAWSYSPREIEFFYLARERLFPLDIDALSDWGAQGERTYTIPLLSYDMPWYFDPFETLSPGWQVLHLLSGAEPSQKVSELLTTMDVLSPAVRAQVEEILRPVRKTAHPFLTVLRQLCAHVAPPLSLFSISVALLQRKTGNRWLDTDPENEILFEGYSWCQRHVEEIAKAYHEAKEIEERVKHFIAWLEADMNTHTLSILAMFRQACSCCGQKSQSDEKGKGDGTS